MNKDNKQVVEQAAAYHARMAAHDMTPAEWAELEAWINEHPEHRRVFMSIGDLSHSLRILGSDAGKGALRDVAPDLVPVLEDCANTARSAENERRGWQPWRMAIAASVLLAAIVPVLYYVAGSSQPAPEPALHQTAKAERKSVVLGDGSSLVLNAYSRILVTFTDLERRVVLEHGDIYLDVASDATRPFRVVVNTHEITVVGTTFSVRYRDKAARITVVNGRVEVAGLAPGRREWPLELTVGHQLVLKPGNRPVTLTREQLETSSSWRDGWLHFEDERLEAVVRELEPYVNTQIIIADKRAAELKVGGSFFVDDFDSMLTAIESLLPIKLTHENDRIVINYDAEAPL
jgi:transmembrane sensor